MDFDDELRLLNEGKIMSSDDLRLDSIEASMKDISQILLVLVAVIGVLIILSPGPGSHG